jgi:hypothetical protein
VKRLLFYTLVFAIILGGCGKEFPVSSGGSSEGYDRVVLAEFFTAIWCPNCPKAEAALHQLDEELTINKLPVIHWHPRENGSGDPDGIPEADSRLGGYDQEYGGVPGLPTVHINGLTRFVGAATEADAYANYKGSYDIESTLKSPLEITLTPEIIGSSVVANTSIAFVPDTSLAHMEITFVLIEHEAENTSPYGPDTWSYLARATKTQLANITGGDNPYFVYESFTIDDNWNEDHLYIAVFVQEPGYGEVLQAAMKAPEPGTATYGFTLSADETDIEFDVGELTYGHLTVRNNASVADTLVFTLVSDLETVPEDWEINFCDAALCYGLTHRAYFAGGEERTDFTVDVYGGTAGTGDVGLVVSSVFAPTEIDTLYFTFTAGSTPEYSFDLTAPSTDITGEIGVEGVLGPFDLHNTSAEDLSFKLDFPAELQSIPASWFPMICDDETCYNAPLTIELDADELIDDLNIDVFTSSPGTGTIKLVVSVVEAPSIADTLTFNFTITEAATGFDKLVTAELFTSLFCLNCPKADTGLDQLFHEETSAKMAMIHWHPTEGSLGDVLGITETDALLTSYSTRLDFIAAMPVVVFGGEQYVSGAATPESAYSAYKASYDALKTQKSDVGVTVTPTLSGTTVSVNIDLETMAEMSPASLQLKTILAEHEVPRPVESLPIAHELQSYVARAVFTESVSLAGGEAPQEKTAQFTLDASWDTSKLHVIVILQNVNDGITVQAAIGTVE